MPTTTPNLGIQKPLGNEAFNRAALNANYDIIDAAAAKAATANKLIQRDASGRAKVAAPAASDDVARKDTVDNAITDGVLRQAIINGNFDIWQRGTTVPFVNIINSSNIAAYGPDRWWGQVSSPSSTGNVASFSRQTFAPGQTLVPGNPNYHMRLSISTLATVAAGSVIRAEQRIEGVQHFSGGKATVSFWAKSSVGRTVSVVLKQSFGTGGSPSAAVDVVGNLTTINLTTSWQLFTVTYTIPGIAGKTIGTNNDDALDVVLVAFKNDNSIHSLPSGTIGTWSTGTIDIARIQFNVGDVSLPFQERSFGEELALCQRYYEKSYNYSVSPGTITTVGASQGRSPVAGSLIIANQPTFKTKKRTTPTVTLYSTLDGLPTFWNIAGANALAGLFDISETNFGSFVNRTWAANDAYSFQWAADAEL